MKLKEEVVLAELIRAAKGIHQGLKQFGPDLDVAAGYIEEAFLEMEWHLKEMNKPTHEVDGLGTDVRHYLPGKRDE